MLFASPILPHLNRGSPPETSEHAADTVVEMVERVVAGHHHRLWVVDVAQKPIGVISLTDLIAAVIDRMDLLPAASKA